MPRSGSTLFRVLLGNIKGVVSLPETFFFVFKSNNKHLNISNPSQKKEFIHKWVNYYTTKRNINDLDKLKEELNEGVNSYQDVLDITVKRFIEENDITDVKYVIEKSPPHIFFQDDIKNLFPDSKSIYLLRDPRSVAGSMLNKPWSTHNIYTIARSWKKSTKLFGFIKDSIVVRYEDLVAKDKATYERINSFFDSDLTEKEFYNNQGQNLKGVRSDYHTNLSKPVDSKYIDKWKVQLSRTDKEKEILEHVCKDEMRKHGYNIEFGDKNMSFYLNYYLDILKFLIIKISH